MKIENRMFICIFVFKTSEKINLLIFININIKKLEVRIKFALISKNLLFLNKVLMLPANYSILNILILISLIDNTDLKSISSNVFTPY